MDTPTRGRCQRFQAPSLPPGSRTCDTPATPPKDLGLLPCRAARRVQTAPSAAARSDTTGSVPAELGGAPLRRIAGLLRPVPKTSASFYGPLVERPDMIVTTTKEGPLPLTGGTRLVFVVSQY